MKIPIRGGSVSAGFNDPRPLTNPGQHIHGALDIIGGDYIARAPASGIARAYVFIRQKDGWIPGEKEEIQGIAFRDYWQDIYGGIIAIEEPNGRLHLMCHFYPASLQTRFGHLRYIESAAKVRWPAIALVSEPAEVVKGDKLAPVGSAGYSTGPHIHHEVHHSSKALDDYADRIDPTEYIEA